MIKVFLGDDRDRARGALSRALLESEKATPNALVTRFSDVNFDPTSAMEAVSGSSLFGGENIVILEEISLHPEGKDFLLGLSRFSETANTVLVREGALGKEIVDALKNTGKVEVLDKPKKAAIKPENNFKMAEAYARKDKKTAWTEYVRARRRGAAPEELHGIFFWALKSLYISATMEKGEAASIGVKDFTYRNYSQYGRNFLKDELKDKLGELKDMYHIAHRGEGDLDVLLERFILES
jgi:DNA polymerase III delta subunit